MSANNGNNGHGAAVNLNGGVYLTVPRAQVSPWPGNPRKTFDEESLEKLAESIKARGILQPLLVRPTYQLGTPAGRRMSAGNAFVTPETYHADPARWPTMGFQIADGERRFRAGDLAGVTELPVRVLQLSDEDMLEIAITSFEQKADVSPAEKAEGYLRMVRDHGKTAEYLAAKIGVSVSTVRNLLKLAENLPPGSLGRRALDAGIITASAAQVIARVPGEKAREEVARYVVCGHSAWSGPPTKQEAERALKSGGGDREGSEPLSFRDARELVARKFMVELKQAPFSQKDAELLPPAGSCEACPHRVGNLQREDPEGYEGVRADVCTRPECYEQKVQAHNQRLLQLAKESGKKVLSKAESKELFANHNPGVLASAAYVDLAGTCYEGTGKNYGKPWKKVVGEQLEAEIVIAVDPRGGVHELVPRAKVLAIVRKGGGESAGGSGSGGGAGGDRNDREKQERAKRLAENRLQRETQRGILAAAYAAGERIFGNLPVDDPVTNQVLRRLAGDAANHLWGSVAEEMCARRGVKAARTSEQREAIDNLIMQGGAPQLLALLTEFAAGRHLIFGGGSGGDGKALAQALGISRKQIEREAKERIKAAKDAKKKGKAKGGPTPASNGKPAAEPECHRKNGKVKHKAPSDAELHASAAAEGIYLGDVGIDQASVERASIVAKWSGGRPVTEPVKVQPFGWDGRMWVCAGGAHQYGHSSYEVWPLFTRADFRAAFPDRKLRVKPDFGADVPDERRENAYWGVRVNCRGEEYVVGPRDQVQHLTTVPQIIRAANGAGRCRVCGCTQENCGRCIERTGEPCSWTDDKQDLCSACQPLLQQPVAVLHLSQKVREVLEVSGLATVGHLHGLDHLPPGPFWTRPGLTARAKLAKAIGGRSPEQSAGQVLDAVDRWLKEELAKPYGLPVGVIISDGVADAGVPDREEAAC